MYKITITNMDAADLGDSFCGNTDEANADGFILMRSNLGEDGGITVSGCNAGYLPKGLADELKAVLEGHANRCRKGGNGNV